MGGKTQIGLIFKGAAETTRTVLLRSICSRCEMCHFWAAAVRFCGSQLPEGEKRGEKQVQPLAAGLGSDEQAGNRRLKGCSPLCSCGLTGHKPNLHN